LPNSKTYLCNEGYGLVKYKSDRFGFRNNDEIWDFDSHNLFIGDSFVHGACVHEQNTLTSIYSKLSGQPTINLGIGGNNASHYITYSHMFIPKLKPKKVFMFFYVNDFVNLPKSLIEKNYLDNRNLFFSETNIEVFNKEEYAESSQAALKYLENYKFTFFSNFIPRFWSLIERHYKLQTIRMFLLKDYSGRFKSTKRAIEFSRDLCEKFNCDLTIVYIPNSHFLNPNSFSEIYADKIEKLTLNNKIKFVDGSMFLDRSKNSKDYAISGIHLSPEGYSKLARILHRLAD